jgi:hypothetical protein
MQIQWEMAWQRRYKELIAYKQKHGDCNAPGHSGSLGNWVGEQRKKYCKGALSKEHKTKLDNIGFAFKLTPPWISRYKELVKYKESHGHCNVPCSHETLGGWISYQRTKYAGGKMSKNHINMLHKIGFVWRLVESTKKGSPVAWSTRYNELVTYKEKHGDCNVPWKDQPLGTWVHNQRSKYLTGGLSGERIELLNRIGFVWKLFNSDKVPWISRYNELVNYKKQHGHCNVSGNNAVDGLSRWVLCQRAFYANGKLSKDCIKLLNEIGFSWSNPTIGDPPSGRFGRDKKK